MKIKKGSFIIMFMFFLKLLNISISASILIIIIMFLKNILGKKLSPYWHYGIWFILVLKLLLPITPQSCFSVFNLVNNIAFSILRNNYPISEMLQKSSLHTQVYQSSLEAWDQDLSLSINHSIWSFPWNIVFFLWVIGLTTFTIKIVFVNAKAYHLLKESKAIHDLNIVQLFKKCKERLNIKANIQLVETYKVKSPALFGLHKTSLLLPIGLANTLSMNELEYIILHELAHYKRKDILANLIVSLLQVLHWFNPLIWYAFTKMREDRELACDSYVLSKISADQHQHYAYTLISVLEFFQSHTPITFTAGFLEGKHLIKKRILAITSFKNNSKSKNIFEIVLAIIIGCTVLTGAQTVVINSDKSDIVFENVNFEDLSTFFKGYTGSFVLYDLKKDECTIYNKEQSISRVSPCSTFKILSSLIALQNNILQNEKSTLKWDGTKYPFDQWNQDHTLASAMKYSADWYFQKVNSKIGREKMQRYINTIGYGNKDISGNIENFWQQSALKISPVEQVKFLKGMYSYDVPFSKENINTVKKIINLYQDSDSALFGKTGSGIENNKYVNGWFIGYIENNKNVYIFATNICSADNAEGKIARDITLSILNKKKILTASVN